MILHYLASSDQTDQINELVTRLPAYKHDGKEEIVHFELEPVQNSNKMIVQFSLDGKSLPLARFMDKINDLVQNAFQLTVLINESSARFNLELYPLINEFERKLRTMLYLKCAGNPDSDVVDKLESMTFEKIYELLFTDKDFVNQMKQITHDKTGRISSQAYYLREIGKIEEHTKWDKIVNSANLDFIKENFLTIIDYRNDVMHAHNISYEMFHKAKQMFTFSIVDLEKEIRILIESSEYREISQNEMRNLLENLTSDIPDEVKIGLYYMTRGNEDPISLENN